MNAADDALPPRAAAPYPSPRTFRWALRRELWEHRALYLAPAAAAAFAAFVHFLSALFIPHAERNASLAGRGDPFDMPYNAVTGVIVVTGLLVGVLYSAGALHGERRDRSILFWKSLPVSDRTSVLAKAAVPLLVMPAIGFVAAVAANLVMITLQTLVWAVDGYDPRQLWARVDLPAIWGALLYGLPFMSLWYAPAYAWLLFVSGWARRWPFLWGAAPVAALLIVEHLALHHTRAHWAVERWLAGGVLQPYTVGGDGRTWIHGAAQLEPGRIYTLPALWLGLILAAAFLFAAIRMRRARGPL
jgi:ABC-2 type transport system permease protein